VINIVERHPAKLAQPGKALVRSCVTKRLSVEDIGAGSDLHAKDAHVKRQNGQSREQEQPNNTTLARHARQQSMRLNNGKKWRNA
jgi:hypothetical protein